MGEGSYSRPMVAFKNNHFTEICSGSETVAYLRLIDSCITQLKAQGPSRTCNESKEEEEEDSGEQKAPASREASLQSLKRVCKVGKEFAKLETCL